MVEDYCVELKCYKNFDTEYEVRLATKKSDKLTSVHRKLRDRFNVMDGELSRLLKSASLGNASVMDLDRTVQEAGLSMHDAVVLQTLVGGKWCDRTTSLRAQLRPKETPRKNEKILSPGLSLPLKNISISDNRDGKAKDKQGLCGLNNLGNSCYMNSVLQCLSNCPPFTEYFLEGRHIPDLNKTNALGTRGQLAKAYGDLIQTMWCGQYPCTKPLQFKTQVVRFNSLFSGYSQHDAQELLTYLLDGLHEDLNRVRSKPDSDTNQRKFQPDIKTPKEPWREYKLKNDSVVVDIFHGLLKSRVICPKCEQLSVTFDPFYNLSLPLPVKKERLLKVHFIPYDPTQKELPFKIALSRKGLITELCKEVSAKTNVNPNSLVPAEVSNFHFHKFYTNSDSLDRLEEKDVIHVYEMPSEANDEAGYTIVPVCFWDLSWPIGKVPLKNGFGIPLLLVISKADLRGRKIGEYILHQIEKRFSIPIGNSGKKSTYFPDIYLVETPQVCRKAGEAIKIKFDDNGACCVDMLELLEVNKRDRHLGRKTLIVDLSLAGKEEYLAAFLKNADRPSFKRAPEDSIDLHIYDCIDLFVSCEKLGAENTWFCPSCEQPQRATKKFDMWTLPKILVIHLKRFSYSRYGGKLDTPIDFPIRDLNLFNYVINPAQERVTYDLIGVINHYGSISGGHYTASCRNRNTNSWFCFNDSSVSPLDENEIVSPSAYVLFYSRND